MNTLLIVKTSLFRETSKHLNRTLTTERKFDWRPKFEFLPFEVNNQTKPFRFNYDPIKQENFIKLKHMLKNPHNIYLKYSND